MFDFLSEYHHFLPPLAYNHYTFFFIPLRLLICNYYYFWYSIFSNLDVISILFFIYDLAPPCSLFFIFIYFSKIFLLFFFFACIAIFLVLLIYFFHQPILSMSYCSMHDFLVLKSLFFSLSGILNSGWLVLVKNLFNIFEVFIYFSASLHFKPPLSYTRYTFFLFHLDYLYVIITTFDILSFQI